MCQPKPGPRCSAAVRKARAANRTATLRTLTKIEVLSAEHPFGPDGRDLPDPEWDTRMAGLQQKRFRLASETARLQDEWARTATGRAEADAASTPGTVEHAAALAEKLHAGQVDKLGLPYHFGHVQDVADRVRAVGGTDDEIAAAYLHDTVEDVPDVDEQYLLDQGVRPGAVVIVMALTHDDGEPYDQAVARVKAAGRSAARVKALGDLKSNTDPDRTAALVRVRVAMARRKATVAGKNPDQAEKDVIRGNAKRMKRYLDAISELTPVALGD